MADRDDEPKKIMVPNDRIFERTQGCWNCMHMRSANEFWTERRQGDLKRALDISLNHKLGEQHPKVIAIKAMIDQVDHGVASGSLIRCGSLIKAKTANGQDVGDLVASNFLCDRWSAATGASVARAGKGPDALPEELADKIDN